MTWPNSWVAEQWLYPAVGLALLALTVVLWSYARAPGSWGRKAVLATLKLSGFALLLLCVLEPMRREAIPQKDANTLVILADKSQSLRTRDAAGTETREQTVASLLDPVVQWQAQLEEDFDLRRFTFGNRLEAVDEFTNFAATDERTELHHALRLAADRFRERPCAGFLLLTDGNATDLAEGIDWDLLPPIYPVAIGGKAARDAAIQRVAVSQTNFESAPVTIAAELQTEGFQGRSVTVRLVGEQQEEVARQVVTQVEDGKRFAVRFEVRPEKRGAHFYEVQVQAASEADSATASGSEATLENNRYPLVVDRGAGPYRILYVSGRPNWELKFLRRAVADDDEVELHALVRIARREPKFSFRSREDGRANPLYRGFEDGDAEQKEQYDEPVLLVLPEEGDLAQLLRSGFPKTAADLFQFDALVLDDIEAGFFTSEMQTLIEQFVSDRGGSLLMLGGPESFNSGGYDRTPIGALLPVYLEPPPGAGLSQEHRMQLTREGWLEDWVRVYPTTPQEQTRLDAMPAFETLNRSGLVKPGASILANVEGRDRQVRPALVVQRFGKGRSAALLVGDLWRWHLRDAADDELLKSWRQTARWLVADVPQRLDVQIDQEDPSQLQLSVQVRDAEFQPQDNCQVVVTLRPRAPDSSTESAPHADQATAAPQGPYEVLCHPDDDEPGVYRAEFTPREPGAYCVEVVARDGVGTEIARRETGWVQRGGAAEFQSLNTNLDYLQQLASRTGGRVVAPSELDAFARAIPTNSSMVTETRTHAWWHHWTIFALAIGCLVAEWGLRRWRGMI